MNHAKFLLALATAVAAWCPASFAQQMVAGGGTTAIDATGILQGVAMSAGGGTGTLTVGVVGGPQTDIFTLNQPFVFGPVAVSTDANSSHNIVFNSSSTVFGNIGVTQPGGPFFLNITGGTSGATVNFLGNVFATTLNVGTGTVNFNSGSTNITATNFTADGTISLAPNTTVIGALTTTAGANTGTLSMGGGSVLNGAVGGAVGIRAINVVGGSETAGVSATITGATNVNSFNLGTNTLLIGGALTIANQGPGGVINTTLASPSVFGNIRPVGTTLLGPSLLVNVNVPSTSFIPVGTLFNIVQTQTGTLQSGTNGTLVAVTVQNPTNPLYVFSQVPTSGTIDGLVTIRTDSIPLLVPIAPPPGTVLPPTQPIAAPVVPVLLAATPTADLINVLAGINSLSNAAAVTNAVAQLAPSASDLSAPLVTYQATRQFQNLWSSRLDDIRCDQVGQREGEASTCKEDGPHSGWWLKGFGYLGNQDEKDAFLGYNSRVIGTMIAYDHPISNETRVGFGVGYANSRINGKTFDSDTDINTYQGTIYVGHEPGPWFVNGAVSFGWNEYSGTRQIEFPNVNRIAEARYHGQEYSAYVTAGLNLYAEKFTFTPLASLQYTRLNLGSYTESGADSINLKVKSRDYDFAQSGLGVKVARPVGYDGGVFVPEAHFKWLHELNNPTLDSTAAFSVGSPSFTTPGLSPADDTLNVGAGLTFLSCQCSARTWAVEGVYDFDWRTDNYTAHQGMVKFSGRF